MIVKIDNVYLNLKNIDLVITEKSSVRVWSSGKHMDFDIDKAGPLIENLDSSIERSLERIASRGEIR